MNKGDLDDPKKVARDVSEVGNWGNGDYQVIVESGELLDYLMTLIQQSYANISVTDWENVKIYRKRK